MKSDFYEIGVVLAMIISWSIKKSVIWALVHGFFSWFYVLYYLAEEFQKG